ncbi:MAG TPA: SUMF1/EgtB/PvdO family nonheme iron enzyme [Edaphobacter sp.]|nr:SUMF1/EgtB/PvdO family nonheme iron enzyme [Edaphobacter sp.]
MAANITSRWDRRDQGAEFLMGSNDFYPEERPVHEMSIDGFWMDRHIVTNEQFAHFVEATGYVTLAERALNPPTFPGHPPKIWFRR